MLFLSIDLSLAQIFLTLSDKEFHRNFKYEHLIQASLAVFHAFENPDYKAMGPLMQTSRTIPKQREHIIGCGYS